MFLPPAGENPYKVDSEQVKQRAKLLQRYLRDEQKELQALYALQALMVQMEQPASKHLRYPPPCWKLNCHLTTTDVILHAPS